MNKHYFFALLIIFSITSSWISCNSLQDIILIIDYGSPITPNIAWCLQQIQIPNQTCWYNQAEEFLNELKPKGIILAGGPESVTDPDSPRAPKSIFLGDTPILGICYGQQLMCVQLGGKVVRGIHPEHGKTVLQITDRCALTETLWQPKSMVTIWMGHEDCITDLPPNFKSIGYTTGSKHAIIADDNRKFYGVQFHPEYYGFKEGHMLIYRFVCNIVGIQPDPTIEKPIYQPRLQSINLNACCGRKKINY
jgi:GMP synthase (glutamine-hydrolysing)